MTYDHEPEIEFAPELPAVEAGELFERLTALETLALPEPPEGAEIVGPLVVRGQRTIVVGDSGHGKTSLAWQLVAAAVEARGFLHWTGKGGIRALVVDLEQGLRSVKRGLREAGLERSEAVDVIRVPDGLSLDTEEAELAELDRHIGEGGHTVVVIDPFYKAHRADGNEERAIVDLFRVLDGLRAKHGFALLLPAHPRKDMLGREGARKLTLHDVAGSGAVVRGAEIVVALERLSHGYARLRVLKDRDGDLPVGEAWPLIFSREQGFRLDPKEDQTAEEIETHTLDLGRDGNWRTVDEYRIELGIRKARMLQVLEQLIETAQVEYVVGPAGRSPRARCYRTVPGDWEQSGTVGTVEAESGTGPLFPTSIRDVGTGNSRTTGPEAGTVGAVPHLGDEGYLKLLEAAYDAGHITGDEAAERLHLHELVVRAREAA